MEAGYAVNRHNYIRFLCIPAIPVIRVICQYHSNGHYWLWMYLASAHYANDTLTFLRQQSICFVPKNANPPCVASLRSVEDFWLKKAFYNGGWEATSIPAQKQKIKKNALQIPLLTILFNTVKEQLALEICIGWSTVRH